MKLSALLNSFRQRSSPGFVAKTMADILRWSTAAPNPSSAYGSTAQQACDRLKAHLLDDLRCMGLFGKRQYQPHWDGYDIKYRLGEHWTGKQLQALEAPIPPEARPSTEIVCTTTSFGRCSYEKIDA